MQAARNINPTRQVIAAGPSGESDTVGRVLQSSIASRAVCGCFFPSLPGFGLMRPPSLGSDPYLLRKPCHLNCSDLRQPTLPASPDLRFCSVKTTAYLLLIVKTKREVFSALLRACFSSRRIDRGRSRRHRRRSNRIADCVDSLYHRHHPAGGSSRHRTKRSRHLGDWGRPRGRPAISTAAFQQCAPER